MLPVANPIMAYTETDPLLPRDKPAPEIHYSRPQSINDVDGGDAMAGSAGEDNMPRWGVNHMIATCAGLITVVFLIIVILPEGFRSVWGDGPWAPLTIDQRVNRILSETPLMGIASLNNI